MKKRRLGNPLLNRSLCTWNDPVTRHTVGRLSNKKESRIAPQSRAFVEDDCRRASKRCQLNLTAHGENKARLLYKNDDFAV
jgi:hypothetical protein